MKSIKQKLNSHANQATLEFTTTCLTSRNDEPLELGEHARQGAGDVHCARADHVPFLPLEGTADGKTASPLMPGTSIAALDALLRLGPNTQ